MPPLPVTVNESVSESKVSVIVAWSETPATAPNGPLTGASLSTGPRTRGSVPGEAADRDDDGAPSAEEQPARR